MRYFWLSVVVAISSMFLCSTVYGDRAKGWTDWEGSGLDVSYLFDVGEPDSWFIGPMLGWLDNEDFDSDDLWSIGVQWEMQVDPNASVPVADWIGSLGEFLGLPETIMGRTYVVGDARLVDPFEGEVTPVFAIGTGLAVGPLFLEYVYVVAEGGEVALSGVPDALSESGPLLRIGIAPFKF